MNERRGIPAIAAARLSVVIATWNRRAFVWQAIDSIVGQEYEGSLEIVVVDDGSTDGTFEELSTRYAGRPLPANRRLIIHSNPHTGMTGAMGKGIELCSGDYVSMCDSDDLWEPARATELLAEVEKTPGTLVHTTCKVRMQGGFRLPDELPPEYQYLTETDDPVRGGKLTPAEYPGNVTLRDLLLGRQWRRLYIRGGLCVFPRRFVQGEFALPAGISYQEMWFLFVAVIQGGIRYANLNSYVQRVHGQNDSLPDTDARRRELRRIRSDSAFLEHAVPILIRHASQDDELLRLVARRARISTYRLSVLTGSGPFAALRKMLPSDVLAEPREIISCTLSAKAPAFHDFLSRTRQSLTGRRPAGQVRP